MRPLLLLLLLLLVVCAVFAQGSPQLKIVSGLCRTILNNSQSDTKSCELNVSADGQVPAGTTVRLRQVSAYCTSPIDRAVRLVRLESQLSNVNTDMHHTFVQVMRREVRSPGLHAEYQGSQLMDAYAGPGSRIMAAVAAELGSINPPINCEVRFQGTVVN